MANDNPPDPVAQHEELTNPIMETAPDMICAQLNIIIDPITPVVLGQAVTNVVGGLQDPLNNEYLQVHRGPASDELRILTVIALGKIIPGWLESNGLGTPITPQLVDESIGGVLNACTGKNLLPSAQYGQQPQSPALAKEIRKTVSATYMAYCKYGRIPGANVTAWTASVQNILLAVFNRHPFV